MSKNKEKLVLIDGNAIIHRAYHALPPLSTKSGELVNAVYGFSSLLLKVLSEIKPEYIITTFDLKGETFRHKKFKEYKATRVKAPDELYAQIDRVKEVVRTFGIPIFEKKGFEADDVIGTIVNQMEKKEPGIENVVVTGDLDTLQLVSKKTKVYALRRGMSDTVIYDEKKVKERYGLNPNQMVDYKGLRGDPSDNIPGVKGIGEKSAENLLQEYGSIEKIYSSLGKIKGALHEKLEKDKANALLSKSLAQISLKVPGVKMKLADAKTHEFDRKKLIKLFQDLNFFSLIKRLPGNGEAKEEENVFSGNGVADFKFEKVKSEDVNKFIKKLETQKEVAFSLERRGDNFQEAEILGIAFSSKTGRANFLELNSKILAKLKPFWENKKIGKIGYDLKETIKVLKNHEIDLQGASFDVMLGAYVLRPGENISFSNLVFEEIGEEIEEEKKKSGQLGLEIEDKEKIQERTCQKADYIYKLKRVIDEKIKNISKEQETKNNVSKVFSQLEMPLISVLAKMEILGVKINSIILRGISEKIGKRINNLEKNIYELAGEKFNINSPKQLAPILFEKLELPTIQIKKNKTGYSTASTELEKIRKEHKIISKIEEYREISKLKNTYLDTLPKLVDENSRIHTTFNQAVTATGRLSSSDPNLHNIPIRTDVGKLIRTAFEAQKGFEFLSADYSQIDLRVMAHMSQDEKMIEYFLQGEDIHRATAAQIEQVSYSQITKDMRRKAKALNFGIIYGMSVFGFSQAAQVDSKTAKRFIDEYMQKFPGISNYIQQIKQFARKEGYVETEMGRRRYIGEINSPNFQIAQAAERMAVNMPIQGLSADIMKLAMIKVFEKYKDSKEVRIILQIHDEIILEVKEEKIKKVKKEIKEVMENVYKLKVPLVVDMKSGDNWGVI